MFRKYGCVCCLSMQTHRLPSALERYTSRTMRLRLLLLAFAFALPLASQTYKPKQIRLQGTEGLNQASILSTLALKEGAPLSKAEIETALQRLADSGSFTDVSYTVNDTVLTITVKQAAGAQALPVRFVNFVWWQPAELETLIEKRVPRFHGKLPLSGDITNDVISALTALLAEKGVPDAKVTASLSSTEGKGEGVSSIALSITSPSIVIGDVTFLGAAALVRSQLDVAASRLAGQEFDATQSAASIRNSIADTHRNAGYLDATVDAPDFTPPKKDMLSYEVNASVLVHPGELYHIATLDMTTPPPVSADEAAKVTGLRIGQAAGAQNLRLASNAIARAYASHGLLEAHVLGVVDRNTANHTAAYRFSIDPGQLDHVTSVNGSALSQEQREAFASQFSGKPGAPADSIFAAEVFRALKAMHAENAISISQRLNRQTHTVEMILSPKSLP